MLPALGLQHSNDRCLKKYCAEELAGACTAFEVPLRAVREEHGRAIDVLGARAILQVIHLA